MSRRHDGPIQPPAGNRFKLGRVMPAWMKHADSSRFGVPTPPPPDSSVITTPGSVRKAMPPKSPALAVQEPDYEVIEFPAQQQYMNANLNPGSKKATDGKRCDLCGSSSPAVKCLNCNGQMFCMSCDEMYHRHPKRQTHLRKNLNVPDQENVRPPLPPKGISPAPVPPPRRNKGSIRNESILSRKMSTQSLSNERMTNTMNTRPLPAIPNNGPMNNLPPKAATLSRTPLQSNLEQRYKRHQELMHGTTPNLSDKFANMNVAQAQNMNQNIIDAKRNGRWNTMANVNSPVMDNTVRQAYLEREMAPSPQISLKKSPISASAFDLNSDLPNNTPQFYPQRFNPMMQQTQSMAQINNNCMNCQHHMMQPGVSGEWMGPWNGGRCGSNMSLNMPPESAGFVPPPYWWYGMPMYPPQMMPPHMMPNRMGSLSRPQSQMNSRAASPTASIRSRRSRMSSRNMPSHEDISDEEDHRSTHTRNSIKSSRRKPSISSSEYQKDPFDTHSIHDVRNSPMSERRYNHRKQSIHEQELQYSMTDMKNKHRNEILSSDDEFEKKSISKIEVFEDKIDAPPPPTPQHPWECEHCTFVNEAGKKVCEVCCKTPTAVPTKAKIPQQSEKSKIKSPNNNISSNESNIYDYSDADDFNKRKTKPKQAPKATSESDSVDEGSVAKSKDKCVRKPTRSIKSFSPEASDIHKTQERPSSRISESNVIIRKRNKKIQNSEKTSTGCGPSPPRETMSRQSSVNQIQSEAEEKRDSDKKTTSTGTSPLPQSISTQTYDVLPNESKSPKSQIDENDENEDSKSSKNEKPRRRFNRSFRRSNSLHNSRTPRDSDQYTSSHKSERSLSRLSYSSDAQSEPSPYGMEDSPYHYVDDYQDRYQKRLHPIAPMRSRSNSLLAPAQGPRVGVGVPSAYRSIMDLRKPDLYRPDPYLLYNERNEYNQVRSESQPRDVYLQQNVQSNAMMMDQLMQRRQSDAMKSQGMELVNLLREAEVNNFSADELQIAMTNCGSQHPIVWLKENWANMIDTVLTVATKYGRETKENNVGTVSHKEAKESLKKHKGNIWQAVTECVQQRQRKFAELDSRGKFAREDILTCLTAHQGDVEIAFIELSKTQLTPFLMRIWGPPNGADNESGNINNSGALGLQQPTTSHIVDSSTNNLKSSDKISEDPKCASDKDIKLEETNSVSFLNSNLDNPESAEKVISDNFISEGENTGDIFKNLKILIEKVNNQPTQSVLKDISNILLQYETNNSGENSQKEKVMPKEIKEKKKKDKNNKSKNKKDLNEGSVSPNEPKPQIENTVIEQIPHLPDEKLIVNNVIEIETLNNEENVTIEQNNIKTLPQLLEIPNVKSFSDSSNLSISNSSISISDSLENDPHQENKSDSEYMSGESGDDSDDHFESPTHFENEANNIENEEKVEENQIINISNQENLNDNTFEVKEAENVTQMNPNQNISIAEPITINNLEEKTIVDDNLNNIELVHQETIENFTQFVSTNNNFTEEKQETNEIENVDIIPSTNFISNTTDEARNNENSEENKNLQETFEYQSNLPVEIPNSISKNPELSYTSVNQKNNDIPQTEENSLVNDNISEEKSLNFPSTSTVQSNNSEIIESVNSPSTSNMKIDTENQMDEQNLQNETILIFEEPKTKTNSLFHVMQDTQKMIQQMKEEITTDIANYDSEESSSEQESLDYSESEEELSEEEEEEISRSSNSPASSHSDRNTDDDDDIDESSVSEDEENLVINPKQDISDKENFGNDTEFNIFDKLAQDLQDQADNIFSRPTIEETNIIFDNILQTNEVSLSEPIADIINNNYVENVDLNKENQNTSIENQSVSLSQILNDNSFTSIDEDTVEKYPEIVENPIVTVNIETEIVENEPTVSEPKYSENVISKNDHSETNTIINQDKTKKSFIPKPEKQNQKIVSKLPIKNIKKTTPEESNSLPFVNFQSGHVQKLKEGVFNKTQTTSAKTSDKKTNKIPIPIVSAKKPIFKPKVENKAPVPKPSAPKLSPKQGTLKPFFSETCLSDNYSTDEDDKRKPSTSNTVKRKPFKSQISETKPNNQEEEENLSENFLILNKKKFDLSKIHLKENSPERQIRMLLAEGIVPSWEQAEVVLELIQRKFDKSTALIAANECTTIEAAISYLQQECELCLGKYPMNEMISMLKCTHRCCKECAKNYFTIQITDHSILECNCPFCKFPELYDQDEDEIQEYFSHLDILLKNILEEQVHELFQNKLRDRTVMQDPNFKWCIECPSGFIARPKQKRLMCPDCGSITCASCRKPWESQHDGITCEQFSEWKELNDPDIQQAGVKKHLDDHGIDCPKCRFRFSLARGGCMHFTCSQCKYEFCCGCGKPFLMGAKCGLSPYCAKLGLHSHHPRNCLFYLRDKEPHQLQTLLQLNSIEFKTDKPIHTYDEALNSSRCPVQLQKETSSGLIDGLCNSDVAKGQGGLCKGHYVEYLVGLSKSVDPLPIMDLTEMVAELRRRAIPLPERGPWDTDPIYTEMCSEIIKEKIPLD